MSFVFAARATHATIASRTPSGREFASMDTAAKKAVVADFLARCNRYADGQLDKYRAELAVAPPADALVVQDKIGHWTAYRSFNEHALQELARGELDDWFT
jgi:hypothetical protein